MAESDLVDKLSDEDNSSKNESSKKEEPQTCTQIFSKIISDFSDFLSKRSVYEAAPENSKVLVFNSDLSFKEMIKAFINEDIYCALIYDSKKEFFIGIITITDILFLFQYIIEKAQERKINDYNEFIKEIFSVSQLLSSEEEKVNNENIKDKNFDILKYLTKINYNDYFEVIKKYKKIHILYSISLDSSLLDVLKVIYKVGVHRLVVEETKKKGLNEPKKKENELNIQNNFDSKTEKEEKTEKSGKDKSDVEKSDKEKSEKKLKKVKTKKKVSESEEGKENKEGEKVVKKKIKKVKKKKTEGELDEKDKDKENNENENKEEGEKIVKKKTKKVKKKKTENELNENDKEKEIKEKKEEEKKTEEKKENNNFQKSEKSMIEIEDISNKDVLKFNIEESSKTNLELPTETQNYTGFVTYETVFDFLIYNYYSMEMKEFDLTLEDLKKISLNSSFIKPLTNYALMNEEVHSSFSQNITSKNDILPILTNDKSDIFGFLYLRDYLYFVSNCESNQNLTNEQFLTNMYEGIDDNKPYGKERIIFFEYNDENKKLKIKQLLEKINGAPEKKIVMIDKEDGNKLEIISLKNIFDVLVEMNEKNENLN